MLGDFSVKYVVELNKPSRINLRAKQDIFDEGCMMKALFCATFAVWTVITCVCLAAPKPAIVPGPDDWTVGVRFEHPQQILLKFGGQAEPSRFWYTIVMLTNNTGRDVGFYPNCELMTDTFQIIPAGKDVSGVVFEQIKRRHQAKYPFLELLEKVDSKLLQGEDNAKDIAIIWPDFDAKAKHIKLFMTGLSNETAAIDHPVNKDENGRPIKVFLRKTLELDYALGGDAAFRTDARLMFKEKCWIMR